MPAILKELLREYVHNRLSPEERGDIDNAIISLYNEKVITLAAVRATLYYAQGYSVAEIATRIGIQEHERVETMLKHCLHELEERTEYTDERFLQATIAKYPKFRRYASVYRKRLLEHGATFTHQQQEDEQTDDS